MQNQTIDELSAITAVKLKDLGLSEGTVSLKRDRYFKYIVEFFHEQGELEYNDIVLYAFIDMVEGKKGDPWSKGYCSHLKNAAFQIKECHDTGTLVFHTYPGKKEFNPSQEYLCILKQATESTELKPEFQYAIQGYLRRFCCWLESHGINSFSTLTKEHIFEYLISSKGKRAQSTIAYDIYSIKLLIKHLAEKNICELSIDPAIMRPASTGRRLIPAFSKEDVSAILNIVDRTSQKGKRNYAILLLAITTGLRAGDIAALKLTDIDWTKYEVSIIQGKTFRRLTLPLEPATGNAIGDYILYGRPHIPSEQIFLTLNAPYRRLKGGSSLDSLLSYYCSIAGVPKIQGQSFHSLRRSLGTWMANSKIPIHTISQVLGHKDLRSTKRYIVADMQMLECSLGFTGIPVQSEVLK